MDYAPSGGSEPPDRSAQVIEDRWLPRFDDGMNSVEPQAVEMIALEPVEGIVDREGAHLWNVIIDSMAPRRMGRREERWRVKVEKVTFWAEMIVDDVEKHHQPASMRLVDQHPQIVRPPIGAIRRIEQDPVVTPISAASEVGDRHQFDRGHSGLNHVVELLDRGAKRAAGCERSDMNLQTCRIRPGPSAPSVRPPFESIMIDDLAWPEHVLRLEVRGRVRDLYFAIDTILIERAVARARNRKIIPALGLRLHRMGAVQHHLDALSGLSP